MEPLRTLRALALLVIGLLPACGGPSDADPDAGVPEDGGGDPDAGPLPVHSRLAPARLPFRLALPEIATSLFTTGTRTFDDGTLVGYREASFPVLGTLIAVAALPDTLSELYRMRTAGLSYDEMAAALRIPLGTVKSRMNQMTSRLRRSLLDQLEPQDGHGDGAAALPAEFLCDEEGLRRSQRTSAGS